MIANARKKIKLNISTTVVTECLEMSRQGTGNRI